jgi:hypothetical protein
MDDSSAAYNRGFNRNDRRRILMRRFASKPATRTAKSKRPYYTADTGHFGIPIKVCFSNAAFQYAVVDSHITTRHTALDVGLAESHFIQQEGTQYAMLAIVFNYEEMAKTDALERMGVIYHEVSHTVTHVFAYIGEDDAKIGDESRSYLGEHIFKQVFSIYATEEDKRERTRERDREAFSKAGKAVKGAQLQVDQLSNRGPGSDSIHSGQSISSGTQNIDRPTES